MYADGLVDGVSVASVKEAKGIATRVRLFATLTESDDSPKEALLRLVERKKAAKAKLIELGIIPGSIHFGRSILDSWSSKPQAWQRDTAFAFEIPNMQSYTSKARTAFCADWEFKADAIEEPQLHLLELSERLRASSILSHKDGFPEDFEGEVFIAFVGNIPEIEAQKAIESAFKDAEAQAKQIAKLATHELGKLKAINTVSADESGQFTSLNTHPHAVKSTLPHPFVQHPKSLNEVYACDPTSISRSFKVQLHYELQK